MALHRARYPAQHGASGEQQVFVPVLRLAHILTSFPPPVREMVCLHDTRRLQFFDKQVVCFFTLFFKPTESKPNQLHQSEHTWTNKTQR